MTAAWFHDGVALEGCFIPAADRSTNTTVEADSTDSTGA